MTTTLDKLHACQFCIVVGIKETVFAVFQRLLEMGFIEGAGIEVLGFAPLGDPMRLKIYDSVIAIRKSEAALITVETI